jgi:receptor protein-tyrosine kinase
VQPTPIERASLDQPSSTLSESFRATLASLLSTTNDGHHKRVLVFTSPYTGEGTTTVVSNLAIQFAEIGSKVLLIDADLRRPRLHQIFNQPNSWGLSDLLREKNAIEELPLEALVKRTSVPRLHLLPSGSSHDNIFGLLWSGRLARLLPRFGQEFDYVLIDAPPCLEYTDARIFSRYAETAILVLRPDRSGRDSARTAAQRLQLDGIPFAGVILNAWDLS